MTVPIDLRSFGRNLDALTGRVASLRTSRPPHGGGGAVLLDSVLLELETAEEELRACLDQMESDSQQLSRGSSAHDRERQLLRRVFRNAPFGFFVLDGDGAVRLANQRAAALTGTPLEFLAGKPMPVFIAIACRAAFRSRLASVLRTGNGGVLSCRLSGRAVQADVRLILSRLTGPDSAHPLALVTAVGGGWAAEAIPPARPGPAEMTALTAEWRRLDVMGRITRLLLGAADATTLLPGVAALLTDGCADWAIIDLTRGGTLVREVVAGPAGPFTTAPPDSPVLRDLLETGGPVVLEPVEDEAAFGVTESGAPALAAAGAGSLVSVALPAAGLVVGVLTAILRDDRPGFSLADAALLSEIGAHIGLALESRGLLDDLSRGTPDDRKRAPERGRR